MAGAAGPAGAAAAAAAMAQAIKASGAIVHVEPEVFEEMMGRVDYPLIVTSETSLFSTTYHYLGPYGGLIFYAKSKHPIMLPEQAEIIAARKIWVPQ